MAGAASAERLGQPVETAPENIAPEVSMVKQTAITEFCSPCPLTSLTGVAFITPCPSVTLAEISAMFARQENCVDGAYAFDQAHPLFKGWKVSPVPPPAEPGALAIGRNCSVSVSPHDETLLESTSESSSPASPRSTEEEVASTSSS